MKLLLLVLETRVGRIRADLAHFFLLSLLIEEFLRPSYAPLPRLLAVLVL